MHGGRVWAQPIAVEKQIQAVRSQAAIHRQGRVPGSEPRDFETTIKILGTLGPEPGDLLRNIMCTLNGKLNANLKEQREGEELTTGGWQLLRTAGTDNLSGQIRVRFSNKPEVLGFQKAFQGSRIQVGELTAILEISNLSFVDLPQCHDNLGAPLTNMRGAPGL
jgi:hypothetical protein